MSTPVSRILVVCSGNTCRSPLAAAILSARLAESAPLRDIVVASAGTGAWDGAPASEGSYLVALERGLDLSSHRARLLTRDTVQHADLILAMGASHASRVRDFGGNGKTYLLTDFSGDGGGDVADPFGQDVSVYRATAEQLDQLMSQVVARLLRERPA